MQTLKPLRPRILQPYPLGINVQYQQEQRLQRAKMDAVTNAIAKRTPTLMTDPILNQRVRDYYSGDPRPGEVIGGKIYGAVEWGALLAGISATIAGTVMMFVPGVQAGGAAAIVKGAALTGGAVGAGIGVATGDEATFRATNRIIKDTLVETFTGNTGRGLLNTLMTVGKSMDLIMGGEAIRASIHAAITGEPVGARILRAYGISPTGRETADFEVIRKELGIDLGGFPNTVVDMIGELITDPGFVTGVGKYVFVRRSKNNIAKAIASDPKIQTAIKQNDVLVKSLNDPKLSRRLVSAIFENDNDEIFAILAARGASRENLYEFIEGFSKQVNDAVATKTANKAYAIFNAVDSVDDFFTFTMFKAAIPTTMLIKPTWRFAKNFVLSPKFLQQTDWTAGQKFAYIMRGGKVEYKLEKEIYDETFGKMNKELADYLIDPKTKDGNVDGDLGIAKSKFSDTFKTEDPTIQKQIKEDINNLETEWTKTSDELKEIKKLKNEEGKKLIKGSDDADIIKHAELREKELELAKRLANIKKALSILGANKTDLESLQKIIAEFYHLFTRKNFSKVLFTKNINDLIILIRKSEQHQSLIDLFADSVYGDLLHFIRNNIDVETKDFIQKLYKEKVNSLAKEVPTKKGAKSEAALKKLQKELASETTFRDVFFLDKTNKGDIPKELFTKVEMDADDGYKEALDVIDAVLDTYFKTPSYKVTQEDALSINFLDNVLKMIKQYTDHNSDIAKVYETIKLMKAEIYSSSYRFAMSDSKGNKFFKQGSKDKQYVRNISKKNIESLKKRLLERLEKRTKYYEANGKPESTLEQINILNHNLEFIKTLETVEDIDGIVDFYDLSNKSLLIHLESERFDLGMYNKLESSFYRGIANKNMKHGVSMELLDRIEYSKGIIRKALKDMETYKKDQPLLKKFLEDYLKSLNKVASRTTLDNGALFKELEKFNAKQAQISASLIVSEIFSTVSEDNFFKTYMEQYSKSIFDEDAIELILASAPVKTEEDKIMEEIFGAEQTQLSLAVSKLIKAAKIDLDIDSFVWASIQKITSTADEGLRRILKDFNSNEITAELSDDPEVISALSLLMRSTAEKLEQTMVIAAGSTDNPFIKTALDAFSLFGNAYHLWKDNGIGIFNSFGNFLNVLTGARADWLRLRNLNYMFKDVVEITYDTTKNKIVVVDNGSKNIFTKLFRSVIESDTDTEDILDTFRKNIILQGNTRADRKILKESFGLLETEDEKLYKFMKDNLKITDINKFFRCTRPVVLNKVINNFDKHIQTYKVLKEARNALQKPDILFSLGGEPIKDFNSEKFWKSKRTALSKAERIRVEEHNKPILDKIDKIEAKIKEIEDAFEKRYHGRSIYEPYTGRFIINIPGFCRMDLGTIHTHFSDRAGVGTNRLEIAAYEMLYTRKSVLERLEKYKNLLETKNRQLIEPKEFKKSYTYIVIDTETTSKNANKAGLRQLTVRVVDSSGSEVSTDGPKFDFLFDEKYGNEFEVDPEAEKVHQITKEYLQKNKHKVKSREEAGNLLNEFLEGLMQSDSAPILVAHNATYDGEVLLHNLPILSEYKDILPVLDTYSLFKNVDFGATLSGLSNESILRATGIKVVDTIDISEIRKLGPKDVPELQLLRDKQGNIIETYFNGVPLHNAEADTGVTANLLNFVLKRIQKIADGKQMDVIDLIQKPSENLFTEYGFTYKQLSDIKEILDEYIEQTNMFEFGSDISDILAQAEGEGAEGPLYRFLVDNDIAQADHTGKLATTPFTDTSKLNKLMYIYNNNQLGSETLTIKEMLVHMVAEELEFSKADIKKLSALITDVYDPTHEIDLLFDKANAFNNLFKTMQRDTAVPIKNRDLVALEIIYNGILQNNSLYEFMDLLNGTSNFGTSADAIFQNIFNEFRTKNIAGISEVINYFKKIEEATCFYDQLLSNIPEEGAQRDKMFRMLRELQGVLKNKPKTLEEYDELVQKTILGINGTEDTLSTKVTSAIYEKAIESYSDISKDIISLDTDTSNHLFQLIFQNIMRPLGAVFSNADDMIKKHGIPAQSVDSLLGAFRKLQEDFRSALDTFRRPLREAKKYNRANQFNLVSVDQFFKDTKIQSGFDLISRNNEFGLKFSQDIHSSKAKKKIAYDILDGYTKYEEPLDEADKWYGYMDYSNVGYGRFFNSVLDMLGYKTDAGTQAATFSLRKFRDVFKMLDADELKTKLAWRYLQEHDNDFIRRIAIMVDNTDFVKKLHIEEAKVEEFKLHIKATILYILEKDETLNRNLVGMLDKDLGIKTVEVIKSARDGYYDLVPEVTTEKPIYDYKGYKKESKYLVERLNRFSKETVVYGALRNGSDMFDNMKGSASAEQLSNFFKNHKEYTLVFFDGKQLIRIQATDLVTMQNVLKSEGMFSVVGYDEFIGIRKSWEEKLRKIADDTLLSEEAKHEYMPVIEPKWLRTIQDINTLLIKIPSLMLSIPFMVGNTVAAYLQNVVNNGGRPLKAMGKILKAQSELHKFYDVFSAISTLEDSYKYFGDVDTLEKTWVEVLKNKKTRDEFISFLENNNSPKALKIKEFIATATDKDYEILQKASEFLSTQAAFGELKNLQVHEQIRLEKEAKYQQLLNKSKRDSLEEEEFWKLNKEPNLNYPKDTNIKTLEDEYNYLKKIREDQKVFNSSKSSDKSPIDKLKETLGVEATTIYKRYHILQERFSGQFNKAMSRVWNIRLFKWWSNLNNNIETVFRYAMMDQAIDSGKSLAKASLEVIDRHFIYSDKSIAERFVELMIPFASYPMKAYVLFSDMMTDYTAMKMLYTWYDESWGDKKTEDSAYLNYRKLRGDVPINIAGQDKLLGLTNSLGEALQGMVPQELGRVGMNKLSPIIKAPITAMQGNAGKAATQLPGGGAISGVVRSITELQNTGRFSFGTMTNMTNNFYSQEQARYRSSYRQFPNHRNYYNDMYTKTGFSRMEMRMQNTNLNNLQYRVSDILYTYRKRQ